MGFLKLLQWAIGVALVYIVVFTYSVPVSELERVKGELTYLQSNVDSIEPDNNDATHTLLDFYRRLLSFMEDMNDLQEKIVLNDVTLTTESKIKWSKSENEHERSRRGAGQEYPSDSKCTSDEDDCTKLLTPYCMGQCLLCPPGATGPPGPPGAAGAPGFPGPSGRDGRDAMDLRKEPKGDEEAFKPPPPRSINQPEYNTNTAGAIYVRWGRRECPSTSDMVYQGIAAGASHQQKGSGSNYLCLPDEPIYYLPDTVSDRRGRIYAGEYETLNFGPYANIHQRDVPCVVCMAKQRPSHLMVPARNVCPNSTWTLEYSGHIMSAHRQHYRSEYVCMDLNAEPVEGTLGNDNGALFYPVEGKCIGGLPCGPYVDGYELTCAVCTI